MKSTIVIFLGLTLSMPLWAQRKESEVHSEVKKVTVFQAGAQVTHEASLNLKGGENVYRFVGLPDNLDPQSIQMIGNSAFTIMSVKYMVDYGNANTNPEVQVLLDSLEELRFKQSEIVLQREVAQKELEFLQANFSIKGQNGVLTGEDILEVADAIKERWKQAAYKKLELNSKEQKLNKRIASLEQKLSSINASNANNPGVLVAVLMARKEGRVEAEFSYFANEAGWVPLYDLRSEDIASPIDFSYKAKVHQSTGLDWNRVKLTISTGNPSMGGQLPVMNPWWLNMYDPAQVQYRGRKAKYAAPTVAYDMAAPASRRADVGGEALSLQYNGFATSASYVQTSTTSVNTEFTISVPYDVPSDNQEIEVVMQHNEVKAEYRYMCVPKLDQSAYLTAFMTDWSQYGLLAGESNIYFKGTFVGQGYIDPSLANDTLQVNMGRDGSVVVKREMVKDVCKSGNWAGKKWVTKGYEITIKNQKTVPISIEIVDQLPKSNNSDLEVNTEEISGATLDEEKGELKWRVSMKAGEITKRQIRFTVKYPKKFVVDL